MGADCHHHDISQTGLIGTSLDLAMGQAETRCQNVHARLTPPRRRVLELLLQADGPLKAYDLIAAFGPRGEPAKPPTVYRALEFLERMGFAHRIESLNAYVPCRRDADNHKAAFLICDCCGAAQEFDPDLLNRLSPADIGGYAVRSITLEAHGLCPSCREDTTPGSA
ncbi:MAG: Fur family transcriptional regulator [Phenylobacterium zucineum]|nr:MAG: Fur family transcriptional regulator [Phenylobacterium zucineum]